MLKYSYDAILNFYYIILEFIHINHERMNLFMVHDQRQRRLVEVAYMYYIDGLQQSTIAKKMSISRSMVSLLLSEARLKDIVQIQIKNSGLYCFDLERKLERLWGLKRAIVIPTHSEKIKSQDIAIQLADAASEYLNQILEDNMTITLSWGKILYEMAIRYQHHPKENIIVAPLIGCIDYLQNDFQPNMICHRLAKNLNGQALAINAPLYVSSKELRDMLIKEKNISAALESAEKSDIALFGIGNINNSIMKDVNMFTKLDYEGLIESSAIGNMGTWFFDKAGNFVDSEISNRTIAVDRNKLKNIKYRIAISGGSENSAIIHSALKSKIMNVLITEEQVAKDILNSYNNVSL